MTLTQNISSETVQLFFISIEMERGKELFLVMKVWVKML